MIHDWGGIIGRCYEANKGERNLSESGRRKRGGYMKEEVRGRKPIIPAQAAVSLGRILSREHVVGHGDDGKQDHDEHCQGDKLRPPACACARAKPQPQAEEQGAQKHPSEIECQLHNHKRFYIRHVRGPSGGEGLTRTANPLMMIKLAFGVRRPAAPGPIRSQDSS